MENVIKVEHVTKSYNLYNKPVDRLKETFSITRKKYHSDFKALNDLSFEVKKGECFGIIGTNGSGKSTILKMITGVLTQSSGKITVKGKISALLELGAGFNMDYTGLENIYMNGLVLGYKKEDVEKMIPKIKEFADIGDFINQPVKTYSSGMFARLAFAVAINVNPDILIVDEALSVGDIFFQAKCYKKFEEFKALGKTILFVTHDMTSVLKYCDRVMLLNKGEFIGIGDPDIMVNKYKRILANSYNPDNDEYKISNENKSLWKDKLALNPNPNIYGNDHAKIIDFGIFDEKGQITNSITKASKATIKVKALFNNNVLNPIFSWKLKTVKGLEVMGTNTYYENIDFGLVNQGSIITVTFKFKVPLSADQYLLDISITRFNEDNLEIINRNYEVTTLDVISDHQNVGIVDPLCQVIVERE
ncbi:MAG: ABC transporter ATP-binding protein [Anaeroplasma sp.]